MRRRFILTSIALAALHFLVWRGSLEVYARIRVDPAYIYKGSNGGLAEKVSDSLIELLGWPGWHFWRLGASEFESWAIILGNSVLWGILGAAVLIGLRLIRVRISTS